MNLKTRYFVNSSAIFISSFGFFLNVFAGQWFPAVANGLILGLNVWIRILIDKENSSNEKN